VNKVNKMKKEDAMFYKIYSMKLESLLEQADVETRLRYQLLKNEKLYHELAKQEVDRRWKEGQVKTSLYYLAFKILDGIANTMFRVGSWFSDRAGDCLDRSI